MISFKAFLKELKEDDNNKENSIEAKKHTKILTKEQVIELLKSDKYSQSISNYKKGVKIFRGLNSDKYIEIDPKSFTRKSANTYNYTTLIVDNASEWSSFPKRSKSLVCTQNISQADDYGISYIVFPENNSNIGLVPDGNEDFWFSFNNTSGSLSIDSINRKIDKLARLFDTDDSSYQNIINLCKKIDENKNMIQVKVMLEDFNDETVIKYEGNFLKYLQELLSPVKNNFKHLSLSSLPRGFDEVWTDGECILIQTKYAKEILDNIGAN